MRLVCHACSNPMERTRRGPARFFRCGSCDAHALTDSTLRKILPSEVWAFVWPSLRAAAAPSVHRCPSCEGTMDQTPELAKAADVRLDICDRCRLIWLDPLEFDKIPKVPVVEEDVLPPEVAQAIARAQVALMASEYDAREETIYGPILEYVAVLVFALIGARPRQE